MLKALEVSGLCSFWSVPQWHISIQSWTGGQLDVCIWARSEWKEVITSVLRLPTSRKTSQVFQQMSPHCIGCNNIHVRNVLRQCTDQTVHCIQLIVKWFCFIKSRDSFAFNGHSPTSFSKRLTNPSSSLDCNDDIWSDCQFLLVA